MLARNLILIAVAFGLIGCQSFVYRGKNYPTGAEAEAACNAHHSDVLNEVKPLIEPVAGRLRIVVPNKDPILQRLITGGMAGSRGYIASCMRNRFRMEAAAIERRNIFTEQEIIETSHPDHTAAVSDRATVYFYISPDGKETSWYYVSKTMPRTRLDPAPSLSLTSEWMEAFLSGLEVIARKDNNK